MEWIKCHLFYHQLVGNTRFMKAWNPLDKEMSKHVDIPQRILTNTIEQFCLFFPSTLLLSTYLSQDQMHAIPILVLTWSFGRLAFAFG